MRKSSPEGVTSVMLSQGQLLLEVRTELANLRKIVQVCMCGEVLILWTCLTM